jgi:acyl carrier protein
MSRQDILTELEELLELDPGTLAGNECLEDFPAWDSMSILTCIEVFHQRTGVVLDGLELSRAKNVADVLRLIPGASEPVGSG